MKGKIRWKLLLWYLATVAFGILSYLVSLWFLLGVMYLLLHLAFGPLDWYLVYKLYLKLKEVVG